MPTEGQVAKIEKAVGAAEKELTRLVASLQKTVLLIKQNKFSTKKAKAATAKVLAALKKHKGVTKLQRDKGFDELPDDLQKRVMWIDELMNTLLATEDRLQRAVKMMKKEPEKDYKILSKAAKVVSMQIAQAPKHVGVLMKEIKKGIDPDSPTHGQLALLPMLLMLWLIVDTVVRGLRERPS